MQFQDLKAQAAIIRDEQNSYQNTSLRVGRMFVDILEQLEKVLPDENVKPETLTVEATETSYKLKFSTLTSDGSVKSRELDLPIATDTKAGVMSPALMKGIKDQFANIDSKIINKIAFDDLDLDEDRIAKFMFSMSSTRCVVTYNDIYNVGVLEMFSDSSGHVLTQIFTTQFNILNDGIIADNAHKDDAFYQYTRFYAFKDGSHEQTLKTWSKWKLVYASEDIKNIKESIKKLEEGGGAGGTVKSFSRVDLQKNLSSTTLTEAEAPESALRLEAGANILIGKGENGSVVISATYSSSGGDGIIIIQ